ncbi:MAG: hypothetical protein P4L46_16930 [Fimbriimonas sp.]|nr:hypothetical protein [Fimbriimonas sp.]
MVRRALILCLLISALCGCQGGDVAAPAGDSTVQEKAYTVGEPITNDKRDVKDTNEIALVVRHGAPITIYSNHESAFQRFHDTKTVGFESDDLPPHFQPPYSAKTWEEDSLHLGFGEILYNGELVAAIYEEDKANQSRLDGLIRDHQDQVGDLKDTYIDGQHVKYWFWEKDSRRLMICAFPTGRDEIRITVAMGDDVVMDGLGMSIARAHKDQADIDKSYFRTKGLAVPG